MNAPKLVDWVFAVWCDLRGEVLLHVIDRVQCEVAETSRAIERESPKLLRFRFGGSCRPTKVGRQVGGQLRPCRHPSILDSKLRFSAASVGDQRKHKTDDDT